MNSILLSVYNSEIPSPSHQARPGQTPPICTVDPCCFMCARLMLSSRAVHSNIKKETIIVKS